MNQDSAISVSVSVPRTRKRTRRKFMRRVLYTIAIIGCYSHLTNPFTFLSIVRDPILVSWDNNHLVLTQQFQPTVIEHRALTPLIHLKNGWHILASRFHAKTNNRESDQLSKIVSDIHALRFRQNNPFLISGDHFSVLYPRSLGIFYHSMLDPRTALNENDWKNRQAIYTKTLAYTLSVYAQAERLSTTIVPLFPERVGLVNYFAYPSDTLYSILWGLQTIRSTDELTTRYPFTQQHSSLHTTTAATQLLHTYTPVLQRHYATYIATVTDPNSGLVKKNLLLSSTKDAVKRQSSFYDNVVLWKTTQLAMSLGIIPSNPSELMSLKQKILNSFWIPEEEYFLEDLSTEAVNKKHFSSDWLIAYMSGFLSPSNPADLPYIKGSLEAINSFQLNRPFGLKYQSASQPSTIHLVVRMGAPNYGTSSIWSSWGMEYIKILSHMYAITCNPSYLNEATYQMEQYSTNIIKSGGFPELYTADGKPYRSVFYDSVYKTGWVVSFEQAKAMFDSLSQSCVQPPDAG